MRKYLCKILKVIRCGRLFTPISELCCLHSEFFAPPIKTRLAWIRSTIYATGQHMLSWNHPYLLTLEVLSYFLNLTMIPMTSHLIHPTTMTIRMASIIILRNTKLQVKMTIELTNMSMCQWTVTLTVFTRVLQEEFYVIGWEGIVPQKATFPLQVGIFLCRHK